MSKRTPLASPPRYRKTLNVCIRMARFKKSPQIGLTESGQERKSKPR
jgi:hypothetical protein